MGASPEVAIACCRAADHAEASDLYPDPDSELLREALAKIGVSAELVSWDDPDADWAGRALVVVRSTWDSVDHPDEYLRWKRQVDDVTNLVNPAAVLAWNLDKTYLEDLARDGVRIVPTRWVRPGDAWEPHPGEYVVKPSISAGGRETARYGPSHRPDAELHVARLLELDRTVMIQPYLPSIEEPGEVSMIFIDGVFSHAVRKGAVLGLGDGVQERPWEKMVLLGLTDVTARQTDAANTVLRTVQRRFGQALVYSRVDLVDGPTGDPLVLEVELIDPNLSLQLAPAATQRLSASLAQSSLRLPSPDRAS